ncbi:MAG: caspase family protein, partial [Thermoguttaceae bacterium]|nr:caspase family protein [Thermoguttaceae bacterium]
MNCRNLFLGVVFLVLGAFGGTARGANGDANSNPAKSYAVLFGVGKFESAKLGELPGAVNDMKALRREWFSAPEFEGRVYSLVDGVNGPNALAPTRENFVATLEKLKGLTNDNDAIYICVSTHGVSAFDRSFLCPKNAVDGDLQDANAENLAEIADAKRLLAVSSLLDKISALKGRKVLIIDACRKNTSNAQANSEVHFLKEFEDRLRGKPHANLAVMASCCLGQKARETIVDNGTFRGLFFLYFLEGLAGNAEFNGAYDGEITLIEAYNYANARTKRAAQALRHEQTPELYEANDARNWNGVDRLVLTKRNLFAQSFDAKSLAQESDALFALHAGDALTQKQKEKEEQRQNVNGDYPTIEALMDYSLNAQPGNRLARKLRGYSRRAQADYAGALDDFQRVDEELTLFV